MLASLLCWHLFSISTFWSNFIICTGCGLSTNNKDDDDDDDVFLCVWMFCMSLY